MTVLFYIAAAVAIVSTTMVITRLHAVHALLYLVVSLLSVAVIFYTLGAPFIAALEVIIYAGAIMVLFVFVVMMLNLGAETVAQERAWLSPRMWIGPAILAFILAVELVYALVWSGSQPAGSVVIGPKQVGIALFGPYILGVELVAMLLLAALIGAYHLGQRRRVSATQTENYDDIDSDATRPAVGRDALRTGADRSSGAA
jgi:NADH-quinone oxidoreductase subunit J